MRRAALAIAALAACSPGGAPAAPEPLALGVIASMSGDLGSIGRDAVDAMNLAVSEINGAGGVHGGRALKLAVEDDATTVAGAVEAFDRVAASGAPVALGPFFSGGVAAIAPRIKAAGLLTVSPSASSPQLTSLDDGGYFYRTIPSDTVQGIVLAQLVHEAGRKALCLVHRDDAYGAGLAEVTTRELGRIAPATRVVPAPFAPDATDLARALDPCDALRDATDLGVLFVTFVADGGELVQAAAKRGLRPDRGVRYFGADGNNDPALLTRLEEPALLEGMLGTVPFAPDPATPEGARNQRFEQRFRERFGRAPVSTAANAYDAAYVAALAVEIAGAGADRAAVARAIGKTGAGGAFDVGAWGDALAAVKAGGAADLRGATGDVAFDPATGDLAPPYYFAVWAFRGGALVRDRIVSVTR